MSHYFNVKRRIKVNVFFTNPRNLLKKEFFFLKKARLCFSIEVKGLTVKAGLMK